MNAGHQVGAKLKRRALYIFWPDEIPSAYFYAPVKSSKVRRIMKKISKPYTQLPPPPRTGWQYNNYFLEQLAKAKQAENSHCKAVVA